MLTPEPVAGIISSSPNAVFRQSFFIAENHIQTSKAPGLDGAN